MIQEKIDQYLKERNYKRGERVSSNKFRPSLFGGCLRRQWWTKCGEQVSDPEDSRGLRVYYAGQLFHDFVQQFFPDVEKEVLCETEFSKGYADLVSKDEVIDLKSQHSMSFWHMQKSKDIYEDKYNNWLQVAFYAMILDKPRCRLVFISKDDLCIQEYVMETKRIFIDLDNEITMLRAIKELPKAKPRLYWKEKKQSYGECEYCNFRTKCQEVEKCSALATPTTKE
jgi:hypothetical protein